MHIPLKKGKKKKALVLFPLPLPALFVPWM